MEFIDNDIYFDDINKEKKNRIEASCSARSGKPATNIIENSINLTTYKCTYTPINKQFLVTMLLKTVKHPGM